MHWNSATKSLLAVIACAAMAGCGSSNPGTMSVHLVDGPDDTYGSVVLQVKKLEINGPSGWQTLADFTTTADGVLQVDLLKLRGGVEQMLADHHSLPAGHYDQMRLLLGPGNTVTLAGTTTPIPLKVPSGMQSGVKFPVSFDVAENTTRDVYIDFDAHRSIFVHLAGNSGQYLLRPVVRAVDRLVTGAITGTVTAGGAPLAGVTVLAEALQNGIPVVLRTAVTNASGAYVLDLLPAGGSYYAVAQPVVTTAATTTVYAPQASAALPIAEASPTATWSPAFVAVPSASVGSISGSITNPLQVGDLEHTDTVAVLATFAGTPLIVRTTGTSVASTGETYTVVSVPVFDGGYTMAVERATVDSTGATTTTWAPSAAAPVLATGTTTLNPTVDLSAQ